VICILTLFKMALSRLPKLHYSCQQPGITRLDAHALFDVSNHSAWVLLSSGALPCPAAKTGSFGSPNLRKGWCNPSNNLPR